MTTTDRAELLVDAHADLGEGPVWDPRVQRLWWVDGLAGVLHCYDPVSGDDVAVDTGATLGAVALRASGGLVLARRGGLAGYDAATADHSRSASEEAAVVPLVPIEADRPAMALNDCGVDPAGRLWVGSLHDDEEPGSGTLYRVDADHALHPVVAGTTISNGIGWSPDGTVMYFVDSPTHTVDRFDYDPATGTATNRRPFAATTPDQGMPDGLTVDADGHVWVAYWGGWCVRRFAPDGSLVQQVPLPVAQVTSCAFGGPDLTDLYVTTAALDTDRAAQPHAGALYRVSVGVAGLAAGSWAG